MLAHLATAWRYGYFRDELYFIACAKHLAWGYVDQPPLVAAAAWLSAPFGYHLVALRALPAIAAALTVWLAARIARELGGGLFSRSVAALATLLVPAYLLLGNTLTTTLFEPLSWTLFLYAILRLVRTGDRRYWVCAGAAFTFGMYGKYSMLLLGGAVLLSLLVFAQRRLAATWWFAAALIGSGVALAPNILWQYAHGWPFLEVVRGDFAHRHPFQTGISLEYKNAAQNAGAFLAEQLLYTNPIFVPLWAGGIGLLAFGKRLREYRFIAVAFVIVWIVALTLEAKGYYVIGIYATFLAAGAVAFERMVRKHAARAVIATLALVITLPFVPFSLPVLSVQTFIQYSRALGVTGKGRTSPRLIQPVYAEEFGWQQLAMHVAAVYRTIPLPERTFTGVFADTYGDAGGLNFYGPAYGLPPVISAQNTYYLWGTRGYDGRTLIVVGASQIELIRSLYRHVELRSTYANDYKWIVEGPTPIYVCTDPIAPLPQLWPRLKWYGA